MKKNRTNKFTKGLVCTYENSNLRSFFFELDKNHTRKEFEFVRNIYDINNLDYLIHRTGGGGFHFLSPTMLSKSGWKFLHLLCKNINTECPMTTMRIQPNKYPNESLFWYVIETNNYNAEPKNNSENMALYLNKIFGSRFKGIAEGSIKLVSYPLPFISVIA